MYNCDETVSLEANKVIKSYANKKISLLRQFHIKLSVDEKKHMKSLSTEIQIDNYVHNIIMKKL